MDPCSHFEEVIVAEVVSPSHFVVAPVKRSRTVQEIERELDEESQWQGTNPAMDPGGDLSWAREGAVVGVKDGEGKWRRGQIEMVNVYQSGLLARVFLIDVGITLEAVHVGSRMRRLAEEEWKKPKPLAREFVLFGYSVNLGLSYLFTLLSFL